MASQCFLGQFQTSCLIRSPTSSGAVVLHPCTLLQSFLPFPEWVPLLIFSSLMSPGMPPRPCPYQPFILKISFSSINNSLWRETFSDLYFKPVSLTWVSFLHNPHRNQNQAKIYYYDHFIESLCPRTVKSLWNLFIPIITVNSGSGKVIVWNGWRVNQYLFCQRTNGCPYEEVGLYTILIIYFYIGTDYLHKQILTCHTTVDLFQ